MPVTSIFACILRDTTIKLERELKKLGYLSPMNYRASLCY